LITIIIMAYLMNNVIKMWSNYVWSRCENIKVI
jgi:hypothetical protein